MKDIIVLDEKSKPKSIIIEGNLHYKLKMYCKGKNMKIGGVIEDLIKLYLSNSKAMQKMIDDLNDKK